jgi:hypothetical protein
MAGVAAGLSLPGLEQVAVAQTTQPATKPIGDQTRYIVFELDKQIDLPYLTLRNAVYERWIEFTRVKFSSSKAGELKGRLCYAPHYKGEIVSVIGIEFADAAGKAIAQAKVECPGKLGPYYFSVEGIVVRAVEFQARYAPDQQIAKFRLSLIEEAKKQDKNAAADAK